MIAIKKYSKEDKSVWDAFIPNAKNASFLFYRDFMEYHEARFTDFSLLLYYKEKLIGLLPANRVGDDLYSHQGLTYGGLLIPASLKMNVYIQLFKTLMEYLNAQGISRFFIKPIPAIYEQHPGEEIAYLQFLMQAELVRRDVSSVIELERKVTFSKLRKRGVQKAVKQKLIVKEVTDFSGFWNEVLRPNLQKTHQVLPVHSLKEIELLKSRFPKQIRQFNVYDGDEILAGTTIFESTMVAHAQYISMLKEQDTFGALDLLFHHLITTVFSEKKYFDFGISNEQHGLKLNEGLLAWKEGFGARTKTYSMYEIDPSNVHLLANLMI